MYYNISDNYNKNKKFSYELANMFIEEGCIPIFMCVGSNNIIEDSLGAIVGELLKNYYKAPAIVFGDTNNPLVGIRLKKTIDFITANYFNKKVVVIDACVGEVDNLYSVSLNKCGTIIDIINNHNLKRYGDISITSVTYVKGLNNLLFLPSEKKKMIFNIANFIANGVNNAIKLYNDFCDKMSKIG